MKKFIVLAAMLAVVVGAYLALAEPDSGSFTTVTTGQIFNAGLSQAFSELQGFTVKTITASADTNNALRAVAGLNSGDVLISAWVIGGGATTRGNFQDVSSYVAVCTTEGYARATTNARVAGQSVLLFFFNKDSAWNTE